MDNSVFIINGRFVVNVAKSEVLDRKTKASIRLEPRLMKLLYLFVKQMGQLVRREYIISEIWDDYPGANEGLSQAVSFLRKLLDDEQKILIKTHPRSGYVFDAKISYDHKRVQVKKYAGLFAATIVLILLILLAADIYLRKDSRQVNFNRTRDAELSHLDSIHQADQMKKYSKDAASAKMDSKQVNYTKTSNAKISRLDSIHQAEQMKKYSKDAAEKSTKKDSLSNK